jgi:hypothetical protein
MRRFDNTGSYKAGQFTCQHTDRIAALDCLWLVLCRFDPVRMQFPPGRVITAREAHEIEKIAVLRPPGRV